MPRYKVLSAMNHDGVLYLPDVAGQDVVEFSQDLADRCGAVDREPLLSPEDVAKAAAKAAEEAQAAADAAAAAEAAAKGKGGKKTADQKAGE